MPSMFEDGPQFALDYEKFVNSLELVQVAFLIVALQGSQNKRYYPLRLALQRRLDGSPIKQGVGQLLLRNFYLLIGPGGPDNDADS